jgi:Holliday junction resolvase
MPKRRVPNAAKGGPPTTPDDVERLIQDVLTELGWDSDAGRVARRVARLDQGLPAEDEFIAACAWLGQTELIHKLDQHQSPPASRAALQVPDLLARFKAARPVLIEVKSKRDNKLSLRPDYLGRLTAYAEMVGMPLLIAWKYYGAWTLFEARHLKKARTNYNISFSEAMRQNLLGVLAGDLSYKMAPGAGIVFELLKENVLGSEDRGDEVIEHWQMRVSAVHFTSKGGRIREDLSDDVKSLFATWDLEERQSFSPTHVTVAFQAGDEGMTFAHMALVQLLAWNQPSGQRINWRHAMRRDQVVSSITNFAAALDHALKQEVVTLILHQQPVEMPDFLRRD